MKIAQKILLVLVITSFIPLLGAGVFSYAITQRSLRTEIQRQVDNTANHQTQRADNAITEDLAKLDLFINKVPMRLAWERYNQTKQADTKAALIDTLRTSLSQDNSFYRLHLVDNQGVVIASTDSAEIGHSYTGHEVFQTAKMTATSSIFFKGPSGELLQYLAAPIQLSGTALGVGIMEIRPDNLLIITGNYSELGGSGETYLVRKKPNGNLEYVTPPRFAAGKLLQRAQVSNTDYRGHSVLFAQRPLSRNPELVLVAKIDQAELDTPLTRLSTLLTVLFVITALVVLFSGWYLVRFITIPIRLLTEAALQIRHGNFQYHLNLKSNDEIGVLATTFRDMTNSLLEYQAELAAAIRSLPFGFALINNQNRIVFANGLLAKLVGHPIPSDPAQTEHTLEHIHNDFKPVVDLLGLIHEAQAKGQPIERNIAFGPYFFRLYFMPIIAVDQRVLGTAFIIEDRTENEALQRSRDEFFSIASHELRTPLTAIRGNSDMMLQYYQEALKDPDLHQMVDDIHDASVRLIDIVNDFLDMSRLEQGRMQLKPEEFNVNELVEQLIREYDVTGSRRKLKLSIDPSSPSKVIVFNDRDKARQILVNLLSNAIKYTSSGGVTFAIETTKSHLKISVTDTGQGIPVESQHLLFHKFQQASNNILTRDNTRSTGLGLYISKLLAQAMGGKLYLAHTSVNQGSTFTLEVPLTVKAPALKHDSSSGRQA